MKAPRGGRSSQVPFPIRDRNRDRYRKNPIAIATSIGFPIANQYQKNASGTAHREPKPGQGPQEMHAGTAEPIRVSPPEAAVYLKANYFTALSAPLRRGGL